MQEPADGSTLGAVLSAQSRWQAAQIEDFLAASRLPLRLSSLDTDGFPHITSLWFLFRGGCFYCCTQRQSVVSRQLLGNPRVGLEVAVNAPPYRGILGGPASHGWSPRAPPRCCIA